MKKFIKDYLVIFAIVVIFITVLRQIFAPQEYFKLKEIFILMICALIANLPGLILHSKGELSEKQMNLRVVIHFAILELGVIFISNIMGWITGVFTTVLLAFQIAIIYVFVRWLIWNEDNKSAHLINKKLKELKSKASLK